MEDRDVKGRKQITQSKSKSRGQRERVNSAHYKQSTTQHIEGIIIKELQHHHQDEARHLLIEL